jgi:pantetheine-phosphate adenylyltransferase
MKNKTVVFPGSFDPFTKGHEYVVKKALEIFEEVIIGIGINTSKKYLFSLEKRIAQIESIYKENSKVKIRTYDGLTTKFCKSIDVSHIVRGLRNTIDFEYEKSIAEMNFTLDKIDTVFFISRDDIGAINASIVREIFKSKGRIDSFVSYSEKLV